MSLTLKCTFCPRVSSSGGWGRTVEREGCGLWTPTDVHWGFDHHGDAVPMPCSWGFGYLCRHLQDHLQPILQYIFPRKCAFSGFKSKLPQAGNLDEHVQSRLWEPVALGCVGVCFGRDGNK